MYILYSVLYFLLLYCMLNTYMYTVYMRTRKDSAVPY